jgi:hypothetical protein
MSTAPKFLGMVSVVSNGVAGRVERTKEERRSVIGFMWSEGVKTG